MGLALLALVISAGPQTSRNVWAGQYETRSAAELAAQFENEGRPVYKHRATILELLELTPGLDVVEIGAGSGFLSRLIAQRVGPLGTATATELDKKMVDYMAARARAEGLTNFRAIQGQVGRSGLQPGSTDVVVIVNTYSFFDQPEAMMRSIAGALTPSGRLIIVDVAKGAGEGVEIPEVIHTISAAGFDLVDRDDRFIPGHFALRFRRARR